MINTRIFFLNKQNTQFLFSNSCYGAGQHQLEAYRQEILKVSDEERLNYFIVVSGFPDETVQASASYWDFKKFFKDIDRFFSQEGPKTGNPIKNIVKNITIGGGVYSVRYPGSLNYFSAVQADNKAEIITFAKAKAHELEHKDYNIKQNKNIILLYPDILRNSIKITSGPLSTITLISMIPGNSIHALKKMEIPDLSRENVFEQIFIGYEFAASRKLFFIESLICTMDKKIAQKLKNVFVLKANDARVSWEN